jgi:hypothetical protein
MKNDYYAYLKSEHWRDLRLRKLAQSPWCEVCARTRDRQVHHLRYRNLFDCELIDLMTLCYECHRDFHLAQENLGWTINDAGEGVSMVLYFRTLPIYQELKGSKPTGKPPKRALRDPYGRFKSNALSIMASYRRKRPLTPTDIREMIGKLQTLLASEI